MHTKQLPTVAGLLLFTASLAAADRYQQWADKEVAWIASKRELTEFAQLVDDAEKEAFIEQFWQRRDPTPTTPRNEFKEEHYRRLEYADQNFREGVSGRRTDRGRVYVLHGEPDRIDTMSPDRMTEPDTQIWTYFSIPTARYFKGRMVVVFQSNLGTTVQDMRLGESRTGAERAQQNRNRGGVPMTDFIRNTVRYRMVAAGPPGAVNSRGLDVPSAGIGEYAHYVEDLLRSPGELLDEQDEESRRRLASREDLRQQIRTRISYDHLPVFMSAQDFYSDGGALVNLSWQVPLREISFQEDGDQLRGKLDLMAQITDSSGELVDEFFKSLELAYPRKEWEERSATDFHYLNHFSVPPGAYRVTSAVRDVHSGNLGTAAREVECRDLAEETVALSGLVLSSRLAPAEESASGRELVHQQWKIVPESDGQFSSSDQLVLFFKVYNAQPDADGQPDVVVTYNFFRDGQLVKTSGPRHLRQFGDDGGTIVYSSVIDLASFPAGDYTLQVNAIDYQTRKFAFQREGFRIAEPPPKGGPESRP